MNSVRINLATASPYLRKAPSQASNRDLQDVVTLGQPGEQPTTVSSRALQALCNQAEEPAQPSRSLLVRIASYAFMACTIPASFAGALAPTTAFAQPAGTLSEAGTSRDVAKAQAFGLSESTIEKILEDRELRDSVKTIPDDMSRLYGNLNVRQKKVIEKNLSGKTWAGFIPVDNREAFVTGRAMGMDAFPFMKDRIDDSVRHREITQPEGDQLKDALDRMKQLTPAQRQAVATIFLMEAQARK